MNFDLGYLVVLGAVIVILLIYRQLDKNNRSLEKIRKFAETVRNDLNSFVEERTAAIKDFETVLKVHDKTAGEILRRIQSVEENLLTRTPEIEAMQVRLDQYGTSLKDLDSLSGRVDENLGKLKEESEFVDKVGRRIKLASEQMTALESAFVQIRQEFATVNQKDLEAVKTKTLEVFDRETLSYVERLQQANQKVEDFNSFVQSLEDKKTAFLAETQRSIAAAVEKSLAEADETFAETANKAESISLDVLRQMDDKIGALAKQSEDKLRADLAALNQRLHGEMGDLNEVIESAKSDLAISRTEAEDEIQALKKSISIAGDELNDEIQNEKDRLKEEFQSAEAQMLALTAQLKSDLEMKVGQVRKETVTIADDLRSEIVKTLDMDRRNAQTLLTEINDNLAAIDRAAQENEQKLVGAFEQRLKDYEANFTLRLQKMEMERGETESAMKNLRQVIEKNKLELSSEFQNEQIRLKDEFVAAKEDLGTLTSTLKNDLEELAAEARDDALAQTETLRSELQQALATDRQNAQSLLSEISDNFASIGKTTQEKERQLVATLEQRLKDYQSDFETRLNKMEEDRVETEAAMKALRSVLEQNKEELASEFQTEKDQLKENFGAAKTEISRLTAELKNELVELTADAREEAFAQADKLRAEFLGTLEADRANAQRLLTDVRSSLASVKKESQETESKLVGALEDRIKDYEDSFGYRLQKMEEVERDIGLLDQNLRQSMERVAERVQDDFAAFDQGLAQRRQEEQVLLEQRLGETRGKMSTLEKDLDDLKARAYDNVSEKLQGFEEEFFQDLQKRNAQMQQSFDEWQEAMKTLLEDLRASAERDRLETERNYSDQLRNRIQELQGAAFQHSDKVEKQILDYQEKLGSQVRAYHDAIEETRAKLKDELGDLEKGLKGRFDQEFARSEIATQETFTRLERDVEAKVKLISDNVEMSKNEIQSTIGGTQSEIGIWQNKFTQKFKELENDLGDQYRNLKQSLSEKITVLTDEFNTQKEDLVTRTAEERANLRAELNQLRNGVDDLENTIRLKSESAIEAFQREYETFNQDYQKKNRELGTDIDNKLKDFRNAVQDIREKSEVQQKKIFGRIEDQSNLLAINLDEIDKKQKAFIAQTKIFERADSLKQELQEGIEDLKSDLAKLEVQRKELFEIEGQIARIKKLGDESSEKLTRFIAEKKRIDMMDADFQKIIGLSQAMELRLEQVTSSNDLLQEIQFKIRKLEDYSKDVEVKFERLEKRREVLDSTSDGVDRNFSILEKMEKTVKTVSGEMSQLPTEVEELRKRLKVLSQGKEDADKAVERLSQLDQILRDVEGRISKMEEARDWIARTETRLNEANQAAEEQMRTLATLTRGTATTAGTKNKNAINTDLRQTVIKLARQGWGKEEIARATKLSMGEVELILELGPR